MSRFDCCQRQSILQFHVSFVIQVAHAFCRGGLMSKNLEILFLHEQSVKFSLQSPSEHVPVRHIVLAARFP